MSIRAGLFGATGYTGLEAARLLSKHPSVEIAFATSEGSAGGSLRTSHPQAPDLPLIKAEDAPLSQVDTVFLCLPHTRSAEMAARALDAGCKVIDLSADLRLDDAATYEHWYKQVHPQPGLLPAPYGLPELVDRGRISGSRCVANPGCYATAALLSLAPALRCGLLRPQGPLIVDAKSGVTGAGREPKRSTLFAELDGNFYPYNIGRSHRHLAEIEQMLAADGLEAGRLIFSPHLLPVDRGILATCYLPTADAAGAQQVYEDFYALEPLIEVLPGGEMASLAHVVRTPKAVLSLAAVDAHTLIVICALDNLLKGAASQAVQNFNLMYGLPETTGLLP